MARFRAVHDDAILAIREGTASDLTTVVSFTSGAAPPGPTQTDTAILTDSSINPTTIATQPSTTDARSSSLQSTSTSAASSSSSASAASDGSGWTGVCLAEVIAPIAFVIILIPIVYMIWVRYRTRHMSKLESEPRHSPSPSKELKFHSVSGPPPSQQSQPQQQPPKRRSFLPPMFQEQSKGPSLFDEVRVSMESARQKEAASLHNRSRDDLGSKESSYGVYAMRRDLEDKGRADSIGLFDLPRSSARSSPAQPTQPAQRAPSPTLPSPKVPLFERPPSEAWPLPAAKLPMPEPEALYDPYLKPMPAPPSPSGSPPPNMPLPTPPASRQENQTHSFASSNLLPSHPPSQQFGTSSSGDLSSTSRSAVGSVVHPQYLSGSTAVTFDQEHQAPSNQLLDVNPLVSPSSVYNTPATATFNPLSPGEHRGRHRDSDLVSELSYRSPSTERDQRRQSVDAISVVSAISHRRRRSEREVDTLSVVSALSPETDETPRIPIEHYPHK